MHIAIWRLALPRRQWAALLTIFATSLTAALLLFVAMAEGVSAGELLLCSAVFASYSVVYVILFSALESDSPSLSIIRLVIGAGREGIATAEVRRLVVASSFTDDRLESMRESGLVSKAGDMLGLGGKGAMILALVRGYRHLLGRTEVGG